MKTIMPNPNRWHSEETKKKLSEMRMGSKNPFFGKKHSAETIAKMSFWTREFNTKRQYLPRPARMRRLTETEAAYLAGIIDGEGSIGFRRGYAFLGVYNTSLELMDWLKDLGGPGVSKRKVNPGRKPVFGWNLAGARDLQILLTSVRPYLKIKKPQADAALDYLKEKYKGEIYGR